MTASSEWRLPRIVELPTLQPTPRAPEGLAFWLAEAASEAAQFGLTRRERPNEAGHTFMLLMLAAGAEPKPAAILCLQSASESARALVMAAPAKAASSGASDLVSLIETGIRCSRQARDAARALGSQDASQKLSTALSCWEQARWEQDELVARAGTEAFDTTDAGPVERIAAVAWRSIKGTSLGFDEPGLATMLASNDSLQNKAGELALWRWAERHPAQSAAAAKTLQPGQVRAAHALAVGADDVAACEFLAREVSAEGPSSRASLEALGDVKGLCAIAASKVLLEALVHRETGALRPPELEGLQALGAAAAPAMTKAVAAAKTPTAAPWLVHAFQYSPARCARG